MKREFSAGGVVYKREKTRKNPSTISGQAPNDAKNLQWLVVQHSQHKGWVFPKGLIGDNHQGESKEETALREVREEGGVTAKIIALIPQTIEYWYQFRGEKIFKKVWYFLMEYVSGDIADHDDEVSATEWLTTAEVKKRLTYDNDQKIFQVALELYKKQNNENK